MGLNLEKRFINKISIIKFRRDFTMNRKKTVAICVVLIVLGIIGSSLVITNAMTPTNANNGQVGGNNGTPPGNSTAGGNAPSGTPPTPPGNSTAGGSTPSGTPPALPGNSSATAPSNSTQGAPGNNTQAAQGNSTQTPAGGGSAPPGSANTGLTLDIVDYILLIICDLVIAASIIFLGITRLGKLSITESFKTKNSKIFFIVVVIILATAIFGVTMAIAGSANSIGTSQGSSANIVTAGAYVVDGTTTRSALGGFLRMFGIDWYDVTQTGKTYTSTGNDQSAIVVNGSGSLSIDQATVTKNNGTSSSEENSNFYGLNAALLSKMGSKLKVTNTKITTSVDGANAIFTTGTNSKVTAENVEIVTTGNSSRGLDATYDGTIIAKNIKITTNGAHCAALATDRGEGTVTVTSGVLKTAGEGSPGIYSTGTITATDITSTATGSEAAVIEGKNSITLTNSNLTGYLKHGVMIYQSTSGDAAVGEGTFTMTGGSLTAQTGPLFYSTNTKAIINLENVKLTGNGTLLKASADSWGKSGSNGANVTLNAKNQALNGDIEADNISSLQLNLLEKSNLTAAINANNTAQLVVLNLSSDSTWTVTGDSYLTILTDQDSSLSNIKDNGHTIYYDKSKLENSWLNGKTITLQDGGKLTPI